MAEPRTKEMPSNAGVRVRNLMRRRAVLMNLPGGTSLRLGPGEAAEISEQQARSRECARFCRDGVLQIEGASTAPAESPPVAAPPEAAVPPEEMSAAEALEVSDESAPKSDEEAGTGQPPGIFDDPASTESKPAKASTGADAKPTGRRKDASKPKDDDKPSRGRKGKGDDTEK